MDSMDIVDSMGSMDSMDSMNNMDSMDSMNICVCLVIPSKDGSLILTCYQMKMLATFQEY